MGLMHGFFKGLFMIYMVILITILSIALIFPLSLIVAMPIGAVFITALTILVWPFLEILERRDPNYPIPLSKLKSV